MKRAVSPLSSKHHHHIVVVMTVRKAEEEDSEFEVSLISAMVTIMIDVSEKPLFESPAETVRGYAYMRLAPEASDAMC